MELSIMMLDFMENPLAMDDLDDLYYFVQPFFHDEGGNDWSRPHVENRNCLSQDINVPRQDGDNLW